MNLCWRATYAELTPAELGEVAGVPPDLQRVWRKRGHLPARKDVQAKFDVFQTCEVMLLQALALRGIPLSEGIPIARRYGNLILFAALMGGEGSCEVTGPKDAVDAFVRAYGVDTKIIAELARTNVRAAPPYLVAYDDQLPALATSLPDEEGHHIATTGAFFNLVGLGLRLSARFGRPLVSVRVTFGGGDDKAKQPPIRRLLPRPKDE